MISPMLKATTQAASLAVLFVFGNIANAGELFPVDPQDSFVKFFGESLLHNFHGEAKAITGGAELDLNATPPIQKASLEFKTAALSTFNDARDVKMKEWLHIDVHPNATFSLDSVKPLAGDYKTADKQHPAQFTVAGTLTLNGKKQPLIGTALGWRETNRLIVTGDANVDTLKYGLPQIRMAVITVSTNVKTSYRLSFLLPVKYSPK